MKKFLVKIVFFLALLFIVIRGIKSTVPYYWGSPMLGQKIEHALQNKDKHDTYFIGSSAIYRQIAPVEFDKYSGKNAYNLGFDAMFFLEANYIVEHFLEDIQVVQQPVKIFVDETTTHVMQKENLHAVRNKYHLDFKRMKTGVGFHWQRENYTQMYYHFITFVENQLGIGELKAIAEYHFGKIKNLREEVKDQKGFYPLELEVQLETPSLEAARQKHLNSDRYKNGKSLTTTEINAYEPSFNTITPEVYKAHNTDLIKIYRVPGVSFGPIHEFDHGHLNTKAAKIYSQKLGEFYKKAFSD